MWFMIGLVSDRGSVRVIWRKFLNRRGGSETVLQKEAGQG